MKSSHRSDLNLIGGCHRKEMNMTREEAIQVLKNTAWLGANEDREATEEAVDMAIEALQGGDAETSIPTGTWEEKYISDDDCIWTRRRFYCSSCGKWNTYGKTDFCPHCGAKMYKEGDPE